MKELIIIGAGGHGKVVADIAQQNDYKNIYFIDDVKRGYIASFKVIGTSKDIKEYHLRKQEADFFIAIGDNKIREKIYEELKKEGVTLPVLIHPSAVIDQTVKIEEGTVIMANAVVNAGTTIGKGCIVNTAATVDHDCFLESFVHISPGVHVAGTVFIGKNVWLGIGTNVINNVKICSDAIIGAGTTVIKDIEKSGTHVGLPLRRINS